MKITAPLPGLELGEEPTMFDETTVAYTLLPHAKLNGAATKIDFGIEQLRAETIAEVDPSQFVNCVLNVVRFFFLTLIV